jgi:DtxR family Mn-dependent transcriptional regulator
MNTAIILFLLVLLAALVFWPRLGLLARWRQSRQFAARSQSEDALKHILLCEVNGEQASVLSVAGALGSNARRATDLLTDMETRGLISYEEGRLRLKSAGRELALHVIRAHRLWESYLADQTGVSESKWHHLADRQEHRLSPQETEALAARLGHPTHDPHGDAIPSADGNLPAEQGKPLNTVPPDVPVVITHIEDEPETTYAQLAAQGIRAGMRACVVEKAPDRITLWADGRQHVLAPVVANNIAVAPLTGVKPSDLFQEQFLCNLKPGQRARVLTLSAACRGPERRRLLDLGFVPGTVVEVDMISPGGDPTAYRVRGTVVALRREQANLVCIGNLEAVSA